MRTYLSAGIDTDPWSRGHRTRGMNTLQPDRARHCVRWPSSIASLSEHAHTTSGWEVVDTAPTPDRGVATGRASWPATATSATAAPVPSSARPTSSAVCVTDTYDMADGVWRELCTVPNGLFVQVELDGAPLRLRRTIATHTSS